MFSFLFRVLVVISYILLFSMFCWVIDKIKYLPIALGIKRNDRTPETVYNVGGESSSTSNTLNSAPEWKYDVFLSFAGKDTRLKFTDHLYDALRRSGIKAFRDNEGIERGEVISHQLLQAIKDSSCAVVILSENYANSTWCLEELQMILECRRELGQQVFPIFCDIDPSDVRHQRLNFGEALAKYEKRFRLNKDKVQNWRNALSEISYLSGWDTRRRHEGELIKDIVKTVWTYLSSKLPSYDDNLVGIESRVCDMMTILEIGLDDKRFVGIWGMGGLGKTTLARVVCEKISDKFEVCCFLANVRETLLLGEGLVSLQKKLLSHLKINDMQIFDDFDGMKKIRKLLCNIKVLLLLDDLDDVSQLKNLAESPNWFGKGSRIIITTRYRQVLTSCRVDKQRIYEMKTMEKDESLQLFSNKAFNKDHPEKNYLELSESVVKYAGGLPLALEVLGAFFCGTSEAEWGDALKRLEQIPDDDRIRQTLKISYDGLKNEKEKTIFLDIACFFKGRLKREVTQILKSCDLHPTIGIKVLIEKALLVETKDGRLEMHDLIEELGRDIVRQESPNDVCKRSRLWEFKDIKKVLENNKGSEAIQAIVMQDNYENQGRIEVHLEAFSKMRSIRLLFLDTKTSPLILPRGFKLPDTLKVVQWRSFPFEALPLETPLNELVQVKMHYSRIKQCWNVIQPMKVKFIDLSNSKYFIETPDFSGVPCLEHLCLRSCTSLVKVHPSLGELKELVEVDLHGCINLEILPRKLKTNYLVKLDLGGCKKVVALPEFGKGMEKLSYLDVSHTAITRLPESFGSLIGLRDLNLFGCKICNLDNLLKIHVTSQNYGLNVTSLTKLYLSGCGLNDGSILDDFGSLPSLIILDLNHNDFVNLPTACFSSLFRLLYLSLDYCKKLKSLPRLPPRLIRLTASHCDSMEPLSSDRQLWNMVASLDHEYRGQTEYVISGEEYDDTPMTSRQLKARLLESLEYRVLSYDSIQKQVEHLPLRDFFANVPGCKIPSWFPNKYVPSSVPSCEHEIEVKIPPHLRDSEWSGIVICLHISRDFSGLISWRSKAPEDDDYICKEWAPCGTIGKGQNRHLCIMVLELNEKTCWQHLKARDNSLHIKLYALKVDPPFYNLRPISELECGWRVICKEEIQEWCHLSHFNQLTLSQFAPLYDVVKLPLSVLDRFVGSVYVNWRDTVHDLQDQIRVALSIQTAALQFIDRWNKKV